MRHIVILGFIIILLTVVLSSCKDNPVPPEQQPQATLTLEDVSCTEAWIKLSTANISLPADVDLYRDGGITETISLSNTDTLLYIDSLLPGQTYNFHTVIHSYNHKIHVTSIQLPAATLNATSHNFTWQTWTFGGQAGSCELYDVAIIDENDIWAVGDINIADTSINGYTTYNAVHWDGLEWKLQRIKTNACGGVEYPPIKAIFVFSSNDILFAHIDGSISAYDGVNFINDCSLITELNGSARKIWGISRNNFYVVSGNGFIGHYYNKQWTKIESETDANINDIWGAINGDKIYCAVPSGYEASKRRILTINETNDIDSLHWIGKVVTSTWTNNGSIIYTSGDGIYNNKTGDWKCETSIPLYYTNRIRGVNLNDIFVCGNYGFLAHYNGTSWRVYTELLQYTASAFNSIAVKNNVVAVTGFYGDSAVIVIGQRM